MNISRSGSSVLAVLALPVLLAWLAQPASGQITALGDGPYGRGEVRIPELFHGNVVQIPPASLTCTDVIDFNGLAAGTYNGVIVETGASFAERFVGQSLAYSGNFDLLGATANNPLALQVGAPGENLEIFPFGGGTVLTGCGPVLCPAFNGIGEGSVGALFDTPQSELGITVVGIDFGGSMTVDFFAADGTNIDTLVIPLPGGTLTFGFQRAGGVRDIAGFSIHNSDPAGVGYDDIIYCEAIEVAIDVKFCSDPNGFNCKSKGKTPVTIFGSLALDVNDIDVYSLRLCEAGNPGNCTGSPLAWSVFDRGDPATDLGAAMCAVDPTTGEELDWLNPDGFNDLDVAFATQEVAGVIGCDALNKGDTSLTLVLVGQTTGGVPITSVPVGDVGIDQLLIQNK